MLFQWHIFSKNFFDRVVKSGFLPTFSSPSEASPIVTWLDDPDFCFACFPISRSPLVILHALIFQKFFLELQFSCLQKFLDTYFPLVTLSARTGFDDTYLSRNFDVVLVSRKRKKSSGGFLVIETTLARFLLAGWRLFEKALSARRSVCTSGGLSIGHTHVGKCENAQC